MLARISSALRTPASLLVLTGALLGLMFPFGKLASQAHIPPSTWAFLVAFGASTLLFIAHRAQGHKVSLQKTNLQFYLVSATISLIVPNLLIFTVIPKLGSGFTGLLFTLSPIFTLLMQSMTGLRIPGLLGIAGIVIGFCGAIMVTTTRGEISNPASLYWIIAGLCIPVSLAIGNIYRTLAWPKNALPTELAIGTNFAAAAVLLILVLFGPGVSSLWLLIENPGLSLAQMIAAALMFHCHFRVQLAGGPTYLSQIGYISAAVALLSGTLLLDERYSLLTWIGAGVIVTGIVCSIVEQRQQP